MSQMSDFMRQQFKAGDDVRDAGLTTPPDIRRYDDIVYGPDSQIQKLDVYRPIEAGENKLPVIVSVHGGGWVYGDKERYQYYCMHLAQMGFAVVNFTYRLAPEFKFPAPLEDTNLVMEWILKNGSQYNLDTGHIFGVADSAGANTLGVYANICTNPEYARCFSFKVPDGLDLKAIALNCGQYRLTIEEARNEQAGQLMADYLPDGGSEQELDLIDVIKHLTGSFPSVYVMTCPQDILKGQAPLLVSRLMYLNVNFRFAFYSDKDKTLGHVFHLNMKSVYGQQCNRDECAFFKDFC